jgi:hypothetical protein
MATYRRLGYGSERGVIREQPGGNVHVVGPDDTSPIHHIYPDGYDSTCGWCWLGYTHSERAHAAR